MGGGGRLGGDAMLDAVFDQDGGIKYVTYIGLMSKNSAHIFHSGWVEGSGPPPEKWFDRDEYRRQVARMRRVTWGTPRYRFYQKQKQAQRRRASHARQRRLLG